MLLNPSLSPYQDVVESKSESLSRFCVRVYNYSEHSSYGYQFWTGMPGVNSEIFWMRGHGGQMIAIDPNKERILVTASTHEDPTVLSLFRNWVNSD